MLAKSIRLLSELVDTDIAWANAYMSQLMSSLSCLDNLLYEHSSTLCYLTEVLIPEKGVPQRTH